MYRETEVWWGSASEHNQLHKHLPDFLAKWQFDHLSSYSTIRIRDGVYESVAKKLHELGCELRWKACGDVEVTRPAHWPQERKVCTSGTIWWVNADGEKEFVASIKMKSPDDLKRWIDESLTPRDDWSLAVEFSTDPFNYVCCGCYGLDGHEKNCKTPDQLVRIGDTVHVVHTAESSIMGTANKNLVINRIDYDESERLPYNRAKFFDINGQHYRCIEKGEYDKEKENAKLKVLLEKIRARNDKRNQTSNS